MPNPPNFPPKKPPNNKPLKRYNQLNNKPLTPQKFGYIVNK